MNFHTKVSYIKSGFRIVGFASMLFDLRIGVAILVIAEVLGIVEEINE